MLNEKLLRDKNDFSFFTYSIMNRIINKQKPVQVKMRNGQFVDVVFHHATDNCAEVCFHTEDWEFVWNADGSSYKNSEFDLIEIED